MAKQSHSGCLSLALTAFAMALPASSSQPCARLQKWNLSFCTFGCRPSAKYICSSSEQLCKGQAVRRTHQSGWVRGRRAPEMPSLAPELQHCAAVLPHSRVCSGLLQGQREP